MSGQPTPPRILEAFAINAPDCTPAAPVPGGRTNPFPEASQVGITNGAASLNDGFTAANMTDPAAGGIPPFGVDMNGILYLLSSWIAYLAAGQLPEYDATLQTAITGYAAGAVLSKAASPWQTWTSIVAGNVTDPDTSGAGWVSSTPLNTTEAPTAGTHNDVALSTPSDEIHDVSTAAGNIITTGFVPGRDGQKLTITKSSSDTNTYTLASLTGSAAGHQIRCPAGGILLARQYDFVTIQFNATVNAWVQV